VVFENPEDQTPDGEDGVSPLEEEMGYTPAFSQLISAVKSDIDPVSHIANPKVFLVSSLHKFSQQYPGRLSQMIETQLSPPSRAYLANYFRESNIPVIH